MTFALPTLPVLINKMPKKASKERGPGSPTVVSKPANHLPIPPPPNQQHITASTTISISRAFHPCSYTPSHTHISTLSPIVETSPTAETSKLPFTMDFGSEAPSPLSSLTRSFDDLTPNLSFSTSTPAHPSTSASTTPQNSNSNSNRFQYYLPHISSSQTDFYTNNDSFLFSSTPNSRAEKDEDGEADEEEFEREEAKELWLPEIREGDFMYYPRRSSMHIWAEREEREKRKREKRLRGVVLKLLRVLSVGRERRTA